jgi:hypothetical protein
VSLLLILGFHNIVSKQIDLVKLSGDSLEIQDYAYHIIVVRTFWFDGFGDIYNVSFQQQAISAYVGAQIYKVMPLGITPIALVVWFPFAYVAGFNLALSYTLWIAFSVGVLVVALWNVWQFVSSRKGPQILPIILSLVIIFSTTTFQALHLGQTSVLAAGLLIYLFFIIYKKTLQRQSTNWLIIVLIVFFLGTKPPYLALGFGLLIIYGWWREALYSFLFMIAIFIGITPLLDWKWVSSYLNLLRMYSWGNIPDVYAWAITPETMNIFRSAFRNIIGDKFASLVSNIGTYSVYLSVASLSMLSSIRGNPKNQFFGINVTKGQLFIFLIAGYLLWAPYAGGYEDILLLPVIITVFIVGDFPRLTNYNSLVLFFILLLILHQNSFPLDKPLWLFWMLKVVVFAYMLRFCHFFPEEKAPA